MLLRGVAGKRDVERRHVEDMGRRGFETTGDVRACFCHDGNEAEGNSVMFWEIRGILGKKRLGWVRALVPLTRRRVWPG